MPTANKALIHRWFEEVWNKKREAAIREMLHPDALIYGLGDVPGAVIRGPDAFVPYWRSLVAAVPDIFVAVESVLAEEDKVAARCSVRGRHTGKGLGVEPMGAQIDFTGMVLANVKDGKLYEGWNNFDFLRFYRQIGAVDMKTSF